MSGPLLFRSSNTNGGGSSSTTAVMSTAFIKCSSGEGYPPRIVCFVCGAEGPADYPLFMAPHGTTGDNKVRKRGGVEGFLVYGTVRYGAVRYGTVPTVHC